MQLKYLARKYNICLRFYKKYPLYNFFYNWESRSVCVRWEHDLAWLHISYVRDSESRIKITINWVGNTMLVSYNSRNCSATSHAVDLMSNVYKPSIFPAAGPYRGLAYIELTYFRVIF